MIEDKRCQVLALLLENVTCSQIAKKRAVHRTSIYREVKRNSILLQALKHALSGVMGINKLHHQQG
ncbi:hypothetical protein [Shewanella surugensis]|uniref:hypothetical protein n=1 Tax=Shewanella surugensis TaxID=212020 RepID=UPI0035E1DDF3